MKGIKLKLKHIFKIFLGRDIIVKPNVKIKTTWFGNINAGFYVDSRSLNSRSIIYSFGIGEDISFDEKLIERYDCTVFGFDPTPKTIQFIKNSKTPNNFIFYPYGLYNINGTIKFYLPSNSNHVSCTASYIEKANKGVKNFIEVPVKKFSTIVEELGHKKIDILKLDIEGSEYEVLDEILNTPIEIDQILIEFHHRFPTINKSKTKLAIKKLDKFGYKLAAVSDQNEEFTFIKVRS